MVLAKGIDSRKERLDRGIEYKDGAKFWMGSMHELKNCGVKDILLAATHGLTGFPHAIPYSLRRKSRSIFSTGFVTRCGMYRTKNARR
ncbi:hypothetical protein Holit_02462 [Hollandina sp. SP2]